MKHIAVLAPTLAAFTRWGSATFGDILEWRGSAFVRWSAWNDETYIYEWISSLAQFRAGTWASSVELPGFERAWSVQDYAELACVLNEHRHERTYHVNKAGRAKVKPALTVEGLDLPWGRHVPKTGKPMRLKTEYRFGSHASTQTQEPSAGDVAPKSRRRRQRYTPPRRIPPLPKR